MCLAVTASVAMGATVVGSGQTISFDTTAVTYSMNGGAAVAGVIENGVARFDFAGLDIQTGAIVSITGARPLLIVSNGDIVVDAAINMCGANGWVTSSSAYGGGTGGPGGFAGGGKRTIGSGPGGGGTSTSYGAGGGGYGGAGGASSRVYRGSSDGGNGLGGVAYGDSHIYVLQGGSGGGGGKNSSGGGGGGGAISLVAISGNVTIGSSGAITCNGGDGVFPTYDQAELRYGGGGGAGGAIRIDAGNGIVTINGQLSAKGGHGSDSQWITGKTDYREYHSGGGGGGRIAIYTASGTYTGSGPVSVAGGTGGNLLNPPASGYQTAPGGPGFPGTVNTYMGPMVMPGKAASPSPSDNSTDVDIHNPALTWQRGDASATSWDVYFGTSSQSLQSIGNVTSPVAAAGELIVNTQYFWRVDEHNTYGTVAGSVWKFTARGPACLNPPVGDINTDCYVNFVDSALFAQDWLVCNRVPETACWE